MNRWLVLFCLINIFTATARKTDEAFRVLQRVSKQSSVPVAYSGGYPFSISGDIRSVPS